MSGQAGKLEVTLNLRCTSGGFAGALLTPVGNFSLKHVDPAGAALTIQFDANGDVGVIHANLAGRELNGSFTLGGDSGAVALARVSAARMRDVPVETLDVGTAQWRDDIEYFARELPARHAAAFAHYPKAEFGAA